MGHPHPREDGKLVCFANDWDCRWTYRNNRGLLTIRIKRVA